MTSEQKFTTIGSDIEGAVQSHLFGKPCFKVNGKAFTCYFQNEMVFKLSGDDHTSALALEGAQLFDPSHKGRPMKEWVQVPFDNSDQWEKYAEATSSYVGGK